jgi:Na+/proline symporter
MSGSSSYFDITGTMWIVSLFVVLGMRGMWVQWVWGFPITVFYMAYMGKWIRRSGVLTGAEWMLTRFGKGKDGELARLSYTIFAILTITALLAYTAVGMGKFGSVFLPFDQHLCATLIIGLTGIYVIVGGFHGIVRVEIIQTIVLSVGAIIIAYLGFAHSSISTISAQVSKEWWQILPDWQPIDIANSAYQMFGLLCITYVAKGVLLMMSGPEQMYDFQRFLATKDARDASKMGALWGIIHTVRWPMAMGIAVLAIAGVDIGTDFKQQVLRDPEKALPVIIGNMLPVGLTGLAIAALLSGFLATFSSMVNGGASYIVKDIYQRYINPSARDETLVKISYLASSLLIVLGIIIAYFADSINTFLVWIFGTLGAGVLLPNVLRWYWWRFNGWGYAIGVLSGMVLSLLQVVLSNILIPDYEIPLYISFPVIAILVLIISIVVTLRTAPTDENVLIDFYYHVQPAGSWKKIVGRVKEEYPSFRRATPFSRDALNVLVGLPWIICLYLAPMYLVIRQYREATILFVAVLIFSIVLYFTWYKNLPASEQPESG